MPGPRSRPNFRYLVDWHWFIPICLKGEACGYRVGFAGEDCVAAGREKRFVGPWKSRTPVAPVMENFTPSSQCCLGNLAGDYGARVSAACFYEEAISKGAVPRSYQTKKPSKGCWQAKHPPLSSALISAAEGDAAGLCEHLQGWQTQIPEDDCLPRLFLVDALNARGSQMKR